ncbi:MAG: GerMN domain-containing protein [Acidimicrobiales bacterium]
MVLGLAGGVLGGCGLPGEDTPRVIDPETVPYDLAGPAQRDAPVGEGAGTSPIALYLVDEVGGELRLVRRDRLIEGPVNLDTVVANLMAGGVTGDEREAGMTNQVPGEELRNLNIETPAEATPAGTGGSSVTVEVNAEFFERFPTQSSQVLAIGQIVLTITRYRPTSGGATIDSVSFSVDGLPKKVPTFRRGGDSSLTAQVTADDYADLLVEAANPVTPVTPVTAVPTTTSGS